MPRGPLPNPQRRRTNAPTIPTTNLPAEGRKGAPPRPPKTYELGTEGTAWWRWAWHTPQAAAWSAGDLYVVARRAALEDDLASLAAVRSLDALDALDAMDGGDPELKRLLCRVAALATGRLAVMKESRELDKVLGLTPKGMADLRWSIADNEKAKAPAATTPTTVRRLRAVDPEVATGT